MDNHEVSSEPGSEPAVRSESSTLLSVLAVLIEMASWGDASKSSHYLQTALRIQEAYYGPDHAEVAITLRRLGSDYGELGDASKMRDHLERALRIQEAHY
eukprot:4944330-Amphidinium_carterae.1